MADNSQGYGKRPLWQWVLIYLVIGGVIYAGIYFFISGKKGGYNYNPPSTSQVSPTTNVNTTAVTIQNMSFSPATLTVKVGDSVTWTNQDSVGHTATADDNSFDTGVIENGQSKSVAFNKAGTYTYHCTIHPSMHGTIIVQ